MGSILAVVNDLRAFSWGHGGNKRLVNLNLTTLLLLLCKHSKKNGIIIVIIVTFSGSERKPTESLLRSV